MTQDPSLIPIPQTPLDRLPRRPDQELYAPSFAQQRLWFLDQWLPNSPAYNIPILWRLHGRLDLAVLERSLNEIVRRHEVLRTTLVVRNDEPVQAVAPHLMLEIPQTDLRELPAPQREPRAWEIVDGEARGPFDLTRLPLLRPHLIRLAEEEHWLSICIHHAIFDGWSAQILLEEFIRLYGAFAAGQPSPLPEPAVQYVDFALWQREYLQGEVLQKQLDYWKSRFHPLPPSLDFPTDHPRPAAPAQKGDLFRQPLPLDCLAALEKIGQEERASLFMIMLAALGILLYRYTGQPDVVVGTPIANRTRPELEPLIGFFVNTLPIRCDLSDNPTFRELLGRIRTVALDAYANQDLPFEKLVEALGVKRDLSHNPLFQVMLVVHNTPSPDLQLPGLALEPYDDIATGTSKFDFAVIVKALPHNASLSIEYSTEIFERSTIARLADHFQTLLEGLVQNPEGRILDLPLLAATERRRLLEEWSHGTRDYRTDRRVHEGFETQARETPDQLAAVYGDQHLTYAELDRRAQALADLIDRLA